MKLNIHLMSHPLIKHFSNVIINNRFKTNNNNNYQILKQLGSLITYETIRNWLKTHTLIIKKIKNTQEIIMIDPKESYIIIFNELKYLNFLQDLEVLIPTLSLQLIQQNEINKDNSCIKKFHNINAYTKVIIINYNINVEYIINLLNCLTNYNNIKIEQIRLTCIQCDTNQLISISQEYANLNIYTTKIINN